jgi:hypothetical protein
MQWGEWGARRMIYHLSAPRTKDNITVWGPLCGNREPKTVHLDGHEYCADCLDVFMRSIAKVER